MGHCEACRYETKGRHICAWKYNGGVCKDGVPVAMVDIEKIKLEVLEYLVFNNIKGAVDFVRIIAPTLGLSDAMKFVKQVQAEVEPSHKE